MKKIGIVVKADTEAIKKADELESWLRSKPSEERTCLQNEEFRTETNHLLRRICVASLYWVETERF